MGKIEFEDKDGQNVTFVNPYTFVPVSSKGIKEINAEREKDEQLHTGYLDCTIKLSTPLAIPDVMNPKEDEKDKDHKKYSFLRRDGKPIIPGSSIRGVVRSVYETVTNSCMVTMNPDDHITNRKAVKSGGGKDVFKPCVLKRVGDNWELYPAIRIAVVCEGDGGLKYTPIHEGHEKFKVTKDSKGNKELILKNKERLSFGSEVKIVESSNGHKKGGYPVWKKTVSKIYKSSGTDCFLFLGEYINRKHAESVFKIDSTKPESIGSDTIKNAIKGLENVLLDYRSEAINKNLNDTHFGYRGYEKAKDNGAIPLWYTYDKVTKVLYLSLAAIGRKAYQNSIGILSNGHEPCSNRRRLCPACAIFGMIGKDSGKGLAGRVRITDAICKEEKGFNDRESNYVTLKELGSPRTGYLQFYSKDGKEYDEQGAEINGRKFYWHIPAVNNDRSIYETETKTKRNGTYELINSGSVFTLRVYYDELTGKELATLMYVLSLGGNDSNYLFKFGHGKPLGLGSAKLIIDKKCERKLLEDRYSVVETEKDLLQEIDINNTYINKQSWNDYSVVSQFDYMEDMKVCYPYMKLSTESQKIVETQKKNGFELKENSIASHQWFSKNEMVLPHISDSKNRPLVVRVCEKLDNEKDFEKNKKDSKKNKKDSDKIQLKVGEIYEGVVVGFNPSGYFVRVKLDNGIKTSFSNNPKRKERDRVKLRYCGKDSKGYDQWEPIN